MTVSSFRSIDFPVFTTDSSPLTIGSPFHIILSSFNTIDSFFYTTILSFRTIRRPVTGIKRSFLTTGLICPLAVPDDAKRDLPPSTIFNKDPEIYKDIPQVGRMYFDALVAVHTKEESGRGSMQKWSAAFRKRTVLI